MVFYKFMFYIAITLPGFLLMLSRTRQFLKGGKGDAVSMSSRDRDSSYEGDEEDEEESEAPTGKIAVRFYDGCGYPVPFKETVRYFDKNITDEELEEKFEEWAEAHNSNGSMGGVERL